MFCGESAQGVGTDMPRLICAKPRILPFFGDKAQKLRHKVVLCQQARTGCAGAGGPLGQGVVIGPLQGRGVQPVPGGMESEC